MDLDANYIMFLEFELEKFKRKCEILTKQLDEAKK